MSKFLTYNEQDFAYDHCPTCGVAHMFPRILYDMARRKKEKGSLSCPNGHSWHYTGDTELDVVRRERDKLRQDMAYKDDMLNRVLADRDKATKELRVIKRRTSHGVCPCCNRTFANVARHMTTKHPEFKSEEVT